MSEYFVITGDRLTGEDVLIDLISVAKVGRASSDLVPWIERLSERERRALWGIMYMTRPEGRTDLMSAIWSDESDIEAMADVLRQADEDR